MKKGVIFICHVRFAVVLVLSVSLALYGMKKLHFLIEGVSSNHPPELNNSRVLLIPPLHFSLDKRDSQITRRISVSTKTECKCSHYNCGQVTPNVTGVTVRTDDF